MEEVKPLRELNGRRVNSVVTHWEDGIRVVEGPFTSRKAWAVSHRYREKGILAEIWGAPREDAS